MALRYKEVKMQILDLLLELEPHSRIPSRTALCEKFLVTRTTIDRAVSELIGEGHLYSVDGSGTYVSDIGAGGPPIRKDVRNIGVMLPNIMHDTYPGFLRGIEDFAQAKDINVMICNTDNNAEKQMSYVRRLLNSRVDGIVIIPTVGDQVEYALYNTLIDAHLPFVFCNRSVRGVNRPLICSNDFYGGFLAAKHILDHGYGRIAYLAHLQYKPSYDRYHGYLAALWQAGLELDESLVSMADDPQAPVAEQGYELTRRLLRSRPDTDGIFFFNDQVASGGIQAIKEAGRLVSDEIGVVGYDNTAGCEMLQPKLTSMSYRNYEIGSVAARTVLQMIERPDQPVSHIITFRPEITVRESCLGKRTG